MSDLPVSATRWQDLKDWSKETPRDRVDHLCQQIDTLWRTLVDAQKFILCPNAACPDCGHDEGHIGHCRRGDFVDRMTRVIDATRVESRKFICCWPEQTEAT